MTRLAQMGNIRNHCEVSSIGRCTNLLQFSHPLCPRLDAKVDDSSNLNETTACEIGRSIDDCAQLYAIGPECV
jgi:hypothetical protein